MQKGDLAPDFKLKDQEGNERTLSTMLLNGPVVLFFYPAAMTKGCTKESCHFRDLASEFAALGAQRLGISMDTRGEAGRVHVQERLDYPLLADVRRRRRQALRREALARPLEGEAHDVRDRSGPT